MQRRQLGRTTQVSVAEGAIESLESRTLLSGTVSSTGVSSADVRWVRSALADDQVQIALANLAASRASNQQVLGGGTGFVSSYTARQQTLQQDAQSLGMSYTSTLSGANQALVRRLTNLSGTSFDRAYAAQLIPDENVALAAARREGASQNRLLQADANSDVASLQSDLLTSRAISNSVRGVAGNSNTSTGTTTPVGGITTTTSANQFGATATIGNGASALTISPINVGFATGAVAGTGGTFNTTTRGNAIGGTNAAGINTSTSSTGFGYTSTIGNGNSTLTISPVNVNSVLNGGRLTSTLGTTAAGTNFSGASATAVTSGFGSGALIGGANSPTVSGAIGGIGDTAVTGASGGIDSRTFNGVTTPISSTFGSNTFSTTGFDGAFSTGTVSAFF